MSKWPFYPFFLSLSVILSLYAANVDEIKPREVLCPALICLGGTLAIYLLLRWKVRRWAGLFTMMVIFVLIIPWIGHNLMASLILYATVIGLMAYLVRQKGQRESIGKATPYLNLILLAILIPSLITIGTNGALKPRRLQTLEPITLAGDNKPDIYYILLDRYARADILQQEFDLDNSAFLNELRARGFSIADRSYANYTQTRLSLYAALNMEYVPVSKSYTPVYDALKKTRVAQSLKEAGYTFIQMGDIWAWTAWNPYADINYNYAAPYNFSAAVWHETLLEVPIKIGQGAFSATANTEYKWRKLSEPTSGPTFTFAHFLITHPPYRFGNKTYQGTIAYCNEKVLAWLDTIPSDAIVILQADEGPYLDSDEWKPEDIQQRYAILSAARGVEFYSTISHVNTFRLVFNTVFNTNLALLPDKHLAYTLGKEPIEIGVE